MSNAPRTFGLMIASTLALTSVAHAHPHVFVEANLEVVRNDNGEFTEIRHVWRFDELFSATISLDYDSNGNGSMEADELKEIGSVVKKSIAEYDFYTAARQDGKAISFYEPEEIKTYYEGTRLVMLLSLELEKPLDPSKKPMKLSASDSSYYVAFEFAKENVTVSGNTQGCNTDVEHPDFDELYAENAPSLTESFFSDPSQPVTMGDEFYSWATIQCN